MLREAPLQALSGRAAGAGAALCGAVVVLSMAPLIPVPLEVAPSLGALGLGLWLGSPVRRVLVWVVVLAWSVAMLWSWMN